MIQCQHSNKFYRLTNRVSRYPRKIIGRGL
nr:MAG TPA: hypothetical protein [Caudoviricetes sp.]DAP70956.1 MAG TPA: hypothetical protein [Caudoviricetes sp.]